MKKDKSPIPESPDFKNAIDLLALYSDATIRLAAIKASLDAKMLPILDKRRKEYTRLQAAQGEAQKALQVICERNPHWFVKPKTLTTAYGKLQFRKSTRLECADEAACILRIARGGGRKKYLRRKVELNIEALERCSDEQLAEFGITRVTTENFTVKPLGVQIGEASATEEGESEEAA